MVEVELSMLLWAGNAAHHSIPPSPTLKGGVIVGQPMALVHAASARVGI